MANKTTRLKPQIMSQVSAYKNKLQTTKIPVLQIIVFGSQVKGTAHPDSDIDVAIVSPAFGKDYHDERVKLMGIRTPDVIDIEPHPFHPDDLNDRWSTIAAEINKYGIVV